MLEWVINVAVRLTIAAWLALEAGLRVLSASILT